MRKNEIIFILILIVMVVGLYWKSFNSDLMWDSKLFLKDNISLIEEKSPFSAFKIGYFHQKFANESSYYRPLTLMSFMLENRFWGIHPVRMRMINILIYISSLIVLYLFFKKQKEKSFFPEITVVLFALYPLNLDNILWVVGRGDLFLLLWGGLTFLCLEFFIQTKKPFYVFLSSFFFLWGLLFKEAFLFFLPVILIYEWVKRKKIFIPYHLSNLLITVSFLFVKIKFIGIKNPPVSFFSDILKNSKILLSSLGYYMRTLIFPFYYDRFVPEINIIKIKYLLFGLMFIIFFLFLLYLSKKNRWLLIPSSMIFFFLGGHLLIAFTPVIHYKVYSRYMMVPALGLIWILGYFLIKMKDKKRNVVLVILLLAFIPSIIFNAFAYKSELKFWRRMNKSFPQNGYIIYEIARIHYDKEDYLTSEIHLNKTLSCDLTKETAILVSLLYADIEYIRGDYNNVFRWFDSLNQMEKNFQIKINNYWIQRIQNKKGLIQTSLGHYSEAEEIFRRLIRTVKDKTSLIKYYMKLYSLYLGNDEWEKAKNLEIEIKRKFQDVNDIKTERIKNRLDSFSLQKKIDFYISHKNYRKAVHLIKESSEIELNERLKLAALYYKLGQSEMAGQIIEKIIKENPQDTGILNKIGFFYLNNLLRVQKALHFFRESLIIDKDQPKIQYVVFRLREGYLKKLNKVWPEEKSPRNKKN